MEKILILDLKNLSLKFPSVVMELEMILVVKFIPRMLKYLMRQNSDWPPVLLLIPTLV